MMLVNATLAAWLSVSTLALAVLAPGTAKAAAPASFAIRVIVPPDDAPIAYTNGQGLATGFAVELLQQAVLTLGRTGIGDAADPADGHAALVAITAADWPDARAALLSNTVDVAITAGHTDPGGDASLDASMVYLASPGAWVTRTGSPLVSSGGLANRTFCVMAESEAADYLRRRPLPGMKVVTRRTHRQLLELLATNPSVDIALLPRTLAHAALAAPPFADRLVISDLPVPDFRKEFRFVLRGDNRRLRMKLDEAMDTLLRSGEYGQLCAKWLAGATTRQRQTLAVGGDIAFPPFSFIDEHGHPSGHDVEFVRELARCAGHAANIQLGEWSERQQALADGRVDLLMGVVRNNVRARRLLFSRPYMVMQFVAVVRKSDPRPAPRDLDDLKGRVLAMEADSLVDDLTRNRHDFVRRKVPTLFNTFEELEAGRADCLLAPRPVAERMLAEDPRWNQNLRICDHGVLAADYCIAARLGDEALIAEVDGAIRTLEGADFIRGLYDRWVEPESGKRLGALLRHAAIIIVPLIGAVLVLAIAVLLLRLMVRRRTAELRRTADTSRQLLACCPIALLGVDTAGRVLFWNPSAERIFGWTSDETVGRPLPTVTADRLTTFLADCRRGVSHPSPFRMDQQTKGGATISARIQTLPLLDRKGVPHGLVIAMEDMTDADRVMKQRGLLSSRLQEAQRMEFVGQLAGGVAHDFNNLLQVIIGYCDLLLDPDAGVPEKQRDDVRQVLDAANRSAALVAQLLAIGRRQVLAPQATDLNAALVGLVPILRRAIGESVTVRFSPGARLDAIQADASKLGQILMNLGINAQEAMPKGGHIDITTGNAIVNRASPLEENLSGDMVPPGRYVRLSVRDDGCGMTPLVRQKAFVPFFTTKGPGQGVGLGLSTVYGLVQQHHAFITLRSVPWKGTCVDIWFPSLTEPAPSAKPQGGSGVHVTAQRASGANTASPPPAPHPGTILLAEDTEAVRTFAARVLRQAGYTVLEAADGVEAVRLYDANAGEIDAAVLDVVMPLMDGREVYDHISAREPGKAIVFTSGYNEDALHTGFVLDPGILLIQKPYQPGQLLDTLRQVLAEAAKRRGNNAKQ